MEIGEKVWKQKELRRRRNKRVKKGYRYGTSIDFRLWFIPFHCILPQSPTARGRGKPRL